MMMMMMMIAIKTIIGFLKKESGRFLPFIDGLYNGQCLLPCDIDDNANVEHVIMMLWKLLLTL